MRASSRARPRRLPISACGRASGSPSWARPTKNGSICDLAAQSLGAIVYGIYPTASAAEVEYQMRDGGAVLFVAENQEYADKLLPLVDALAGSAPSSSSSTIPRCSITTHPKLMSYHALLVGR